jgi:hypothetical protein
VPILTTPLPTTLLPLNTAAHSIKALLSAVQTVITPVTVAMLVPVTAVLTLLPVVVVVAPLPLPVRANSTIIASASFAEGILSLRTLGGVELMRFRVLADVDAVVALMVAGLPVGDAVDTHCAWTLGW